VSNGGTLGWAVEDPIDLQKLARHRIEERWLKCDERVPHVAHQRVEVR
jgi:hypothetical protein